MLQEFKDFVMRDNVIYLAIGFGIGVAFAVVVNLADLFISLDGQKYESLAAAKDAGAATINFSFFINAIIVFLVVTVVIFVIHRAFRRT